MEKEIWKDIPGYEGYYQISTFGNVKSIDRTVKQVCGKNPSKYQYNHYKSVLLKPFYRKDGYIEVSLCKNKKYKKYLIHRLMGITFLENKYNYPEINHKDENKQNNNLSNLEWCTSKYNTNYGTKIQRVVEQLGKMIYEYDIHDNLINCYKSITLASKSTGIHYKKLYRRINTGKYLNNLCWYDYKK